MVTDLMVSHTGNSPYTAQAGARVCYQRHKVKQRDDRSLICSFVSDRLSSLINVFVLQPLDGSPLSQVRPSPRTNPRRAW